MTSLQMRRRLRRVETMKDRGNGSSAELAALPAQAQPQKARTT
jgi:hypothetical protein